ncbi:MAG: hypothetical protein ABIB43_03230, partial [archaeon]
HQDPSRIQPWQRIKQLIIKENWPPKNAQLATAKDIKSQVEGAPVRANIDVSSLGIDDLTNLFVEEAMDYISAFADENCHYSNFLSSALEAMAEVFPMTLTGAFEEYQHMSKDNNKVIRPYYSEEMIDVTAKNIADSVSANLMIPNTNSFIDAYNEKEFMLEFVGEPGLLSKNFVIADYRNRLKDFNDIKDMNEERDELQYGC